MTEQRRLAAIVSADVAGYSRLMGRDESGTLAALKALRQEVVDPAIASHGGRIVKTIGDGLLLEFPSVVNAVRCAVEVQTAMADRAAATAEDRRMVFRVGINIGDIIVEGDDIFGDGVNVAARLQEIAAPGGICIASRVHEDVRDRLDTAFDDGGTQALKNIARPVQVWRWQPGTVMPPKPAPEPAALPLPDKPSIAVLPFQNMSGDPEQEYFADGMVEDIITALSRTNALFVIARNSSFTYKGRAVDVKVVGRELGVRYVLEGSVRKAANRVRITGQLIDASNGTHIWADRFEGSLESVFDLQDEVTSRVVAAISPTVEQAEIARSRRKPTEDLRAYDYYLRAVPLLRKPSNEAIEEGLRLLGKAVGLDNEFALAVAAAANFYVQRKIFGLDIEPEKNKVEAERLARRALELGSKDPRVLSRAGFALVYVVGLIEEGAGYIDQAVEIDSNLAGGWTTGGWAKLYLGRESINYFEKAYRLNPLDPSIHGTLNGLAHGHCIAGHYDEAVAWAEKTLRHHATYVPAYWALIVSHVFAGRIEKAKQAWAMYQKVEPNASISNVQARMGTPVREILDKYAEALRLVGMPE